MRSINTNTTMLYCTAICMRQMVGKNNMKKHKNVLCVFVWKYQEINHPLPSFILSRWFFFFCKNINKKSLYLLNRIIKIINVQQYTSIVLLLLINIILHCLFSVSFSLYTTCPDNDFNFFIIIIFSMFRNYFDQIIIFVVVVAFLPYNGNEKQ